MFFPLYSVAATTLAGPNGGPDLSQIYGVLYKAGSAVDWPAAFATISISNLPLITSITPITLTSYGADGRASGISTFGELQSGGAAVRWPATLTGLVVTAAPGSATTSIPSTSPAQTSATTTAIANTGTGTSTLLTSTSSPSPPVSSPSSGVSTGAAAGIAIGCALVGLAIGLVAAFCFSKRKGKRNSSSVDNVILRHELEATPSDKVTPINDMQLSHELDAYPLGKGPPPVNDMQLSQFLLEATPDRDIAQETQSIGALIDQHVESYFHTDPITVDTGALASVLTQLGFPLFTSSASRLDAPGAAALCLDPGSRQVGLRHVIMRVLFSSIDIRSTHGPSMLPAPVASFLRAIPPTESDRLGDSQANALALRKWRNLSAFLLHPARSERTSLPTRDAGVAVQAQELGNSLNSFLRFFVDPHHHQQQQQQQRVDHLQAVIKECAKLGYVLFSHPSDWEFVYEEGVGAANLGGVVVEVGLCKLRGPGRDGAPDPCPQRLVEPVVISFPFAK